MFNKYFKNIVFEKGFVIVTIATLLCMGFFLGKLFIQPNETFFKASDDGMQAYYGALYHVKYDTSYWHSSGMNYPYGEQVFFTGCQPIVTNIIKLISTVIDISAYTIGIINLIMLFSVALCSFVLYFLFKHLRVPPIFGALAAVAITFLSPQFIRMGGHYSLTYQFAIPLFLLLLLKFYESPNVKKSILISLFVFFIAATQFYFFGFFAIIAFSYWLFIIFSVNSNIVLKGWQKVTYFIKHIFIQLVLPFIVLQFMIFLINNVHDRTAQPWGYLEYFTNITGVFFPMEKTFYSDFLLTFIKPEYPPSMEGYSYIGLTATLVFILFILISLKRLFFLKFKEAFKVTDNIILNAFLWAAILALFLSFAYPFRIHGYGSWLNYAGPLKQLRAIGRFAWVFYYIINIIAIYKISQWANGTKQFWKISILSLALLVLIMDAYYTANNKQDLFNNKIIQLSDKKNLLPQNLWFNKIEPKNYQAIIGLPYFHVGSENFWIASATEIVKHVFVASLKTGLPTTMVFLSRTSISQTLKNIQIVKEKYRKLEIVNDFNSVKPFLVLARESELNDQEKELLSSCRLLTKAQDFNVYELEVEVLKKYSEYLYTNKINELAQSKTFPFGKYLYTDSIKNFVACDYDETPNSKSYIGAGCYAGKLKDNNVVFFDIIPNSKNEQTYNVSFWMDNFNQDMYPRTTCVIEGIDTLGASYNRFEFLAWYNFKALDGNYGLIENKITLKNKKDRLAITIYHYDISDSKKLLRVDNLLVRPSEKSVYKLDAEKSIMFNNRTYFKN